MSCCRTCIQIYYSESICYPLPVPTQSSIDSAQSFTSITSISVTSINVIFLILRLQFRLTTGAQRRKNQVGTTFLKLQYNAETINNNKRLKLPFQIYLITLSRISVNALKSKPDFFPMFEYPENLITPELESPAYFSIHARRQNNIKNYYSISQFLGTISSLREILANT